MNIGWDRIDLYALRKNQAKKEIGRREKISANQIRVRSTTDWSLFGSRADRFTSLYRQWFDMFDTYAEQWHWRRKTWITTRVRKSASRESFLSIGISCREEFRTDTTRSDWACRQRFEQHFVFVLTIVFRWSSREWCRRKCHSRSTEVKRLKTRRHGPMFDWFSKSERWETSRRTGRSVGDDISSSHCRPSRAQTKFRWIRLGSGDA